MKSELIMEALQSSRKQGMSLLGAGETISELKATLGSKWNRSLIAEIKAEADRMTGESDPELTYSLFRIYGDSGERLTYEHVYFERRKRMNAFAIMSLLEPENSDYIKAFHNTIWSICNEYTWCLPAHFNAESEKIGIDLFAAETGFALSEVLLLHQENMPPLLQKRIKDEIEQRLFRPFLEEGPFFWEKADHNWAAVCAGSIGAAAIHLMQDTERLTSVLERVLGALECYLSGFGDDGACAEGYMYWQYGFGFYVYFAQLLKAATDGKLDLFRSAKVKAIASFQQKCFTGGNTVVNFSDSMADCGIFMGLSFYLHDEYDEVAIPDMSLRASYAGDHCGRWAPAIRNLLWTKDLQTHSNEALSSQIWPAESHYLSDTQWLLSRHISNAGDNWSFAAKGGHNDEPHNHNDVGHFILHGDGDTYMADLGSGMYTSSYFSSERYDFWCNGSQGHSVPIIGGEYQRNGRMFKCTVSEAVTSETEDLFTIEMSGAYSNEKLVELERRFHWSKTELPALTLTDTIVFSDSIDKPDVVERFICLLDPVKVKEGQFRLEGKKQLDIFYDNRDWEPTITARSDIDHYGHERFWYTMDFKLITDVSDRVMVKGHFIFQFQS